MPERKTLSASELIPGRTYVWETTPFEYCYIGPSFDKRHLIFQRVCDGIIIAFTPVSEYVYVPKKVKRWINVYYKKDTGEIDYTSRKLYHTETLACQNRNLDSRYETVQAEIEIPESL